MLNCGAEAVVGGPLEVTTLLAKLRGANLVMCGGRDCGVLWGVSESECWAGGTLGRPGASEGPPLDAAAAATPGDTLIEPSGTCRRW